MNPLVVVVDDERDSNRYQRLVRQHVRYHTIKWLNKRTGCHLADRPAPLGLAGGMI